MILYPIDISLGIVMTNEYKLTLYDRTLLCEVWMNIAKQIVGAGLRTLPGKYLRYRLGIGKPRAPAPQSKEDQSDWGFQIMDFQVSDVFQARRTTLRFA